ncbi:DUF1643 domain-containing protein [Microcella flavibacter]|uniref:DUF1643 domain-containing protein n=1 Tax=Microcella flavibacter TaxID=1804990 RepID=UPI0014577763|nr:DUF1643 domain-containing protein [Microcella flavibacter]
MTQNQRYNFTAGQAPDYWNPNPEHPDHRFALGRVLTPSRSLNPLVVIAMNPSYADHSESDRTVNTVIAASSQLGHDGWLMLNLYPERRTKPNMLGAFDAVLWARNWAVIDDVLDTFAVNEVLGAWGNPPNHTIREALKRTRTALHARGTRVYHFGTLTKSGSPRHPTPRGAVWNISGSKRYLA